MNIAPSTIITLCNCPLYDDYKNTLSFNSSQEQFTYFNSKPLRKFEQYSYTRANNSIVVSASYDEIQRYNYLFYENRGHTVKIMYCFIKNIEYISENSTRIYFETDVFQTWMFELVYQPSFIEREHTNNDSIGANTIPENLELGTYVTSYEYKCNELEEIVYMLQASTKVDKSKKSLTNFGGVYSAGVCYVCESTSGLDALIHDYDFNGNGSSIYNVYTAPKYLCKNGYVPDTANYHEFDLQLPVSFNKTIPKLRDLAGYIPKNNKLFTFPYCYMLVHNNNGGANTYNYEDFSSSECVFTIDGIPVTSSSIRLTPQNYKRNGSLMTESITGGKYAVCNWNNDYYTNWITQNGINLAVSAGSGLVSLVAGLATSAFTGNPLGLVGVGAGFKAISDSVQQVYNNSIIPDSIRGSVNSGDIVNAYNMNTFYFLGMSIKSEYAKIIDNYFSMYGYKTNLTKVPNIKGRKYWNYVKTINCNLDGNIPQKDLELLKQIFDNGVTIWHDPNNIYNYAQTNSIV